MAYPAILSLGLAASAVAVYLLLRVGRLRSPLAAIAACLAFFFGLALLYSLSQALSPDWNGWFSRALHGAMAGLLVLPLVLFGSLSRSFEPASRRVIGHLWTTPTAVYLSTGGRARRVAPAAGHAEAYYVEARAPRRGVLWQGLRACGWATVETRGKGREGFARAGWTGGRRSREHGAARSGSTRSGPPPQREVSIVRERQELKFLRSRRTEALTPLRERRPARSARRPAVLHEPDQRQRHAITRGPRTARSPRMRSGLEDPMRWQRRDLGPSRNEERPQKLSATRRPRLPYRHEDRRAPASSERRARSPPAR